MSLSYSSETEWASLKTIYGGNADKNRAHANMHHGNVPGFLPMWRNTGKWLERELCDCEIVSPWDKKWWCHDLVNLHLE